jgi:hypothetical protein
LPQLTLHHFDFLQLFNDYALGKPAQDRALAKLQFELCHVDGTLMMGDHHGGEVAIRITSWGNVHVFVHAFHGPYHQ